MQETEAIIERIWQVSPTLQRLEVTVEPSLTQLVAGQSVLALTQTSYDPYLREHWIPVAVEDGQLIVERPVQQRYMPGQIVQLLGAVGNALPWAKGGGRHLLLLAQDTPPTPLLMLAQSAVQQMAEVTLVLTGTATEYPFAGIPAAVEVINGQEDGTWRGQEQLIQWADQIFAVVSEAFWLDYYAALFHVVKRHRLGQIPPNFLYGLFNHLAYPCGTGVCGACMVRCKTSLKLGCTQGPAFDLTEVQLA